MSDGNERWPSFFAGFDEVNRQLIVGFGRDAPAKLLAHLAPVIREALPPDRLPKMEEKTLLGVRAAIVGELERLVAPPEHRLWRDARGRWHLETKGEDDDQEAKDGDTQSEG